MKARIPISYTFELRDSGHYGFMLPERLIQRAVEEATRGVSAVRDHLVKKFNVEGKRCPKHTGCNYLVDLLFFMIHL